MPSNTISAHLYLFSFSLGLATITFAAPPASKPTQEDKAVPLYSETLTALYEVPEVLVGIHHGAGAN